MAAQPLHWLAARRAPSGMWTICPHLKPGPLLPPVTVSRGVCLNQAEGRLIPTRVASVLEVQSKVMAWLILPRRACSRACPAPRAPAGPCFPCGQLWPGRQSWASVSQTTDSEPHAVFPRGSCDRPSEPRWRGTASPVGSLSRCPPAHYS